MGTTPKPPRLSIVPKPKRRDETVEFETDGPPTDRVEIPVSGPAREESLLFTLPNKRFARGEIVVSEHEVTKIFYFIESGRAAEYALTSRGEAKADERVLNPTDIIGLTQCVRVIARSDLSVRVIDFDAVEQGYDNALERFVSKLIREAAVNANSVNRDRVIRATEEMKTLRMALASFDEIRASLARVESENAEHRTNGRMLSREIMRQREVIAHLQTIVTHREAELGSALSITGMYKDDYLELAKAIASYGHLFEDMQNSEDSLVASTGFKLLSFLHTLRITTGIPL